MREIKFKGLGIDSDKWCFGNYFHNFRKGESHNIVDFQSNEWYEVKPETVGQFVKTINEQDYFVGDIVRLSCDSFSERLGTAKGNWKTVVIYDEYKCQFALQDIERKDLIWLFDATDFNGAVFTKEVIGNVHEKSKE